jgi:uncharacterized protein (TIGR03067 family)
MRSVLCLALAFLALALSGLRAADPKKSDKDLLQGLWKLVKEEKDEENINIKDTNPDFFRLRFKGDNVTVELPRTKEEGTFKLGLDKKIKTIDFMPTTGEEKGLTLLGIYVLEGDDLKICVGDGSIKERPKEFKSDRDKIVVYYLKREKK